MLFRSIRKQLQCNDFSWYLHEVYPELLPLKRERGKRIQIRSGQFNNMCLDTLGRTKLGQSTGLYQCHDIGGNQEWLYDRALNTLKHAVNGFCISTDFSGIPINSHCSESASKVVIPSSATANSTTAAKGPIRINGNCLTVINQPHAERGQQFFLRAIPCNQSDGDQQQWEIRYNQ